MKRKYNFGNFDNSSGNPYIGLPLINSNLSVSKLFKNSDSNGFLRTDDSNLMYITFRNNLTRIVSTDLIDSIPGSSFEELREMPPIAVGNFTNNTSIKLRDVTNKMQNPTKDFLLASDLQLIVFDGFTDQEALGLSLGSASNYSYLSFSEGLLTMTITNNWAFDLTDVVISIVNRIDKSIVGTFTFDEIKSGETKSDTEDLEDKLMDSDLSANIVSMSSPSTSPDKITLNLEDMLDITIVASNLKINTGQATIPAQDIFAEKLKQQLPLDNGEILDRIQLKDGRLIITLESTIQQMVFLNLDFNEFIDKDGNALHIEFSIQPGEDHFIVESKEIDLSDYWIYLTNVKDTNTIHPKISVSTNGGSAVTFDTTQYFKAHIQMKNMRIKYTQGYLGQTNMDLSAAPIELNFETDVIPGNLQFYDPEFNIRFVNSFGLPIELNLSKLTALINGDTTKFTGTVIDSSSEVGFPTLSTIGDSVTTRIFINKSNSNIKDILNAKPSGINPNVSVIVNKNGYTDRNFFLDESKLSAYLNVDIPFYATLSDLNIKDTLDASQITSTMSNFAPATIKINLKNGFPVEIILNLIFCDSAMNSIETITIGEDSRIPAGTIDERGNVTEPSVLDTEILISEEIAENIKEAQFLILDVKIQSPEDGTVPVKFYTDNEMEIKIGILSQLKIF